MNAISKHGTSLRKPMTDFGFFWILIFCVLQIK